MAESKIYPHFAVENNKKPNRFYAFPFIGLLAKIIILIPVFIEMLVLGFVTLIMLFISWFVVLFTGKYWHAAYKFFVGVLILGTKVQLFIYGITDKYPGFTFNTNKILELEITKPEKLNRWFAVPFIGIFVRFILLFPYLIFSDVLDRGSFVAMFLSWFAVLFKGRLPESLYEFEKDTLRVSLASSVYIFGLSDKYPSFNISMNHQTAKILLIIAGTILMASTWGDSSSTQRDMHQNNDYNYSSTSDQDNNTY